MNIDTTLNNKLLHQVFEEEHEIQASLSEYKRIAQTYAQVENAIAVLSDLKSNKSHIYYGALAETLGISPRNSTKVIDSIWEEEIFNKIHPDDLRGKYVIESQFFQLLKGLPSTERTDYHAMSKIRMCGPSNTYITILHRIFYVCSFPNGSLWLTLCLYHFAYDQLSIHTPDNMIINSATGKCMRSSQDNPRTILSDREKEVLKLIRKGRMSKEIADLLNISVNTVNRHRQNILEKLLVSNSMEACRVAELMKLI